MGRLVISRNPGQRTRIEVNGVVFWIETLEPKGRRSRYMFEAPECVQIVRDDAVEKTPSSDIKCVGQNVLKNKHRHSRSDKNA